MPPPKDPVRFKEFCQNISESKKGNIPWNKGKKGLQVAWNKGKRGSQKHSEETKRKIGEASKGNQYALGYKHSEETKKNLSERNKGIKRPGVVESNKNNQYNWKGGCYTWYHSKAHELFCPNKCSCGITCEEHKTKYGGRLNMHCVSGNYKIIDPENWIGLCNVCHVKLHKKLKEQERV